MPENPYYRYRYLALADDEDRHDAWETIENVGYIHGTKYNNWMEERWNDQIIMSEGFSIHNISAEKQGFFSTIGRIFK